MDVVEWLLSSDPAIRWQVMSDLTDAIDRELAPLVDSIKTAQEREAGGGKMFVQCLATHTSAPADGSAAESDRWTMWRGCCGQGRTRSR